MDSTLRISFMTWVRRQSSETALRRDDARERDSHDAECAGEDGEWKTKQVGRIGLESTTKNLPILFDHRQVDILPWTLMQWCMGFRKFPIIHRLAAFWVRFSDFVAPGQLFGRGRTPVAGMRQRSGVFRPVPGPALPGRRPPPRCRAHG